MPTPGFLILILTVPLLHAACQAASRKLDDDRRQLQDWGARLAALTHEFDDAKQEVKAARTEIQDQRAALAGQVGGSMGARPAVLPGKRGLHVHGVAGNITSGYPRLDLQDVAVCKYHSTTS